MSKKATNLYDFGNFNADDVDQSTLAQSNTYGPFIYWATSMEDEETPGFFYIKQEEFAEHPGDFWNEDEIRFGGPNNPMTAIWKTNVLRCCPLAERSRLKATDNNRKNFLYPSGPRKFTKYDKIRRIHGADVKIKKQMRIKVALPKFGSKQLFELNLASATRVASWTNDLSAQYSWDAFPDGAYQKLLETVAKATEEKGFDVPVFAFWWTDLRGVYEVVNKKNRPMWVEVGKDGSSSYINPFTADLRIAADVKTQKDKFPTSRFVGGELYRELVQWLAVEGEKWTHDWDSFNKNDDDNEDEGDGWDNGGGSIEVVENDEIPF
ncbi:MAG: hypothetical protein DRI46_12145 [Chloroflexi bacterium]|nr:MAG: hypothetical protein DRI46_12145 [Chloroflexota bacterium]